MHSPKISVVVPSFNKVGFISETLESIFKQKYPNLEVIVQDGESTDGTLRVIKKYAKKYPKVLTWESKKDKGQLDAINKGLKKASGDILTFINADDVYLKNAFKEIANEYTKSPNALWFAGKGIVIDENGKEIAKLATLYKNMYFFINRRSFLLILNYLMQPSVFITKKTYKKYGPFTGTKDFVTEYNLWLKLGKIQMPKLINKNLSKFRIEQGTKTKILSKKLLKEDERIVRTQTNNWFILSLHNLHNKGRLLVEKTI